MDCGDTFLMPAPGGAATPHLWIVITQPDPLTHECAIVSVTTLRNSKDQTIILRVGDHPFIRHDSTIFYGDAMIVDARRLEAEIAAGLALVAGAADFALNREIWPNEALAFEQAIGHAPLTFEVATG